MKQTGSANDKPAAESVPGEALEPKGADAKPQNGR
jgi:hypothetical protein